MPLLMAGIRKSDNASPSRERSRIVEAVYTICSMFAICSIPVSEMSFRGPKHADYQGQTPNPAKTTEKTNASLGGEAQVMGGFPKRSGCLYKIYGAEPSPLD